MSLRKNFNLTAVSLAAGMHLTNALAQTIGLDQQNAAQSAQQTDFSVTVDTVIQKYLTGTIKFGNDAVPSPEFAAIRKAELVFGSARTMDGGFHALDVIIKSYSKTASDGKMDVCMGYDYKAENSSAFGSSPVYSGKTCVSWFYVPVKPPSPSNRGASVPVGELRL